MFETGQNYKTYCHSLVNFLLILFNLYDLSTDIIIDFLYHEHPVQTLAGLFIRCTHISIQYMNNRFSKLVSQLSIKMIKPRPGYIYSHCQWQEYGQLLGHTVLLGRCFSLSWGHTYE